MQAEIVIFVTETVAILSEWMSAQQIKFEGPQNTLKIVGSNVTLKCSPPSGNCIGVDWQKSILQTNPETVFSDRNGIYNAYRDRYRVNNSSGCDLVINDVKLTDAGRFTCRVFISPNTNETSAFLIILATQPKCATNAFMDNTAEGDEVQLTCELTYRGTDKALMSWKGVEDVPGTVEYGENIRRSYSLVASGPEVPSFACVISFQLGASEIVGLASNTLTTACETAAQKILYSVRNVTLSPSLSDYPPETTVTCIPSGHPPSSFKWQVLESENDTIWTDIKCQTSNQFAVGNDTSRRYRCVAMNVVRGKRYIATSHEFQVNEFQVNDVKVSEDLVPVGIRIGSGIGLLAAILLVSIALASLAKLGYLEFHRKSTTQPRADVAQRMKQEKSPSFHQHSSIPSRETASDGPQETAYASLDGDRDKTEYKSLEQRQRTKPKKTSTA